MISTTLIIGALLLIVGGLLLWFILFKRGRSAANMEQFSLCMQKSLGVVSEAVVILDQNGGIQYLNGTAEVLLKSEQRSLLGKNFWSLFTLLDIKTQRPIKNIFEDIDKKLADEYLLVLTHKQEISVDLSVTPVKFVGDQVSFALVIRDISQQKILESKLNFMDSYDALTRLPNRKFVETSLKHALVDAKKHNATHVFCYISVDKVKNVTDMAGHAAGDALIIQLTDVLKDSVKSKRDILARMGGDDFAILYREKEPGPTLKLIEQVRQNVEAFKFKWQEAEHQVTASIGFLLVHKDSTNPAQVLSDADIASRIARENGGNRVYVFRPNDESVKARKGNLVWVNRIKHAIENNMFRLFSQPIHPLAFDQYSMPFFHYETLIRLFDDSGKPIPPDEFLPAAEQQGLMMAVDKWVVTEAIRNLKKITQKKPLPVFSINLSGQSINEPQFLEFVLREIKRAEIRPQMICFEITESVAVNDLGTAMRFIKRLKNLGCSFSLDDFGTGVSSYGYLRQLPVDYLKIDGVFVKDMVGDKISQEMVRSINQVGHAMGLEVIAEYVEDDKIIQMLNEIGVDYGQGYGISKPIPIEDAVRSHQL